MFSKQLAASEESPQSIMRPRVHSQGHDLPQDKRLD